MPLQLTRARRQRRLHHLPQQRLRQVAQRAARPHTCVAAHQQREAQRSAPDAGRCRSGGQRDNALGRQQVWRCVQVNPPQRWACLLQGDQWRGQY